MKEKIQRFMLGRYGFDELGKVLVICSAVIMGLSIFTGRVSYMLAIVVLIFSYYRMLSKNHQKRYEENCKYLKYKNTVYTFFNKQKYKMNQRKIYHMYICPSCKQKIRIPKGKGKITITCPKCNTEFKKKS